MDGTRLANPRSETGSGQADSARAAAQRDAAKQPPVGVHEGQILAGKYRVEKVLGVGGMGVVVAATHLQLDTRVALKFLLPGMLRNQEDVGRFAREARAAVRIQSEHVARVSDVGTLENGAPYMVMEFLQGEDLAAHLQKHGPLPVEQAVDFVLQACVGVASAHGVGIVHRDLKPANLFCLRGNDGQFVIKVLDFGISKLTNVSPTAQDGSLTHSMIAVGSPFYMSPEQMQSPKDVDVRTDIWALGIVLYELLTDEKPFVGESYAQIAIQVATASFVPLRSFRSDVPAGLEEVIRKCLEKNKKHRYRNVAKLALALANFGSTQSGPSIERTVRIIQAAGLSSIAPAAAPSPDIGRMSGTRLSESNEPIVHPATSAYGDTVNTAPSSTDLGPPGGSKRRTTAISIAGAGAVSLAAIAGWAILPKVEPHPSSMAPSVTYVAPSSALPAISSVQQKSNEPNANDQVGPAASGVISAAPRAPVPNGVAQDGTAVHQEHKKAPAPSAKALIAAGAKQPPPASTAKAFSPLFDLRPK